MHYIENMHLFFLLLDVLIFVPLINRSALHRIGIANVSKLIYFIMKKD